MKNLKDKDLELFEYIAKFTQPQLKNFLTKFLNAKYNTVVSTDDYIYAEGSIPICLVAHTDTVFQLPPEEIFYDSSKNVLWSPDGLGADDRAGIFAIIKIIQSGLRPHIIFPADEEMGCVGSLELAKKECPFKDLRYIIQLDRQGHSDCVFYGCKNKEFIDYVEDFGFFTAIGSFSDISALCPKWGVAGVNLSIGYKNEHSREEILYVTPMMVTIEKVKKMLTKQDIPYFKYVGEKKSSLFFSSYICDACGKEHPEDELFEVYDLNNEIKNYCIHCMSEKKVTFCEKCYNAFEYEDESYVPMLCFNCSKGGY